MRKIISIFISIIVAISVLSIIFINYRSDIDAINNLNVNINDVSIKNINSIFFKLNFDINIINPSDRDITDLSTDFNIYIEDNYVGEGNFSNVDIPNNSNKSKDVIITVYYDGLADAVVDVIKKIINEGEFDLKIIGTVYAKALFGLSIMKQNYTATKTYE